VSGLLLVAASGLAREVLGLVEALNQDGADARSWTDVVVVDDDPATWGTETGGRPVVGGLALVQEFPEHRVLVCVGSGTSRRAVVERLAAEGVTDDRYATLVHPDVRVPSSCRVGRGSLILAGAVLTADVSIGRHVVVMPHVTLTHDDVVDDFATLCAGVTLAGGVEIGQAAYLGASAAVREHLHVGPAAVIGMGAVLTRDVPAGETWVGTPARRVGTRIEVER
jgi:sugar O-acyltransferase (sialic acid O-acetyltransferase NeuD family)